MDTVYLLQSIGHNWIATLPTKDQSQMGESAPIMVM
jgi:hypothetical protein